MHFRVRGNNVQLVKSVMDPATGKAISRPVGSINLASGTLNNAAKESLSPEEIAGVESWMARKQEIDRRKRQVEAEMLPTTIGDIIQWSKEASPAAVTDLAEEILFGLKDLQSAIAARLKEAA
jgi:hypothetical protein